MNINLIVGLILLYIGLGLAYSEIRRILIARLDSFEDMLEVLSNKFLVMLNLVFYPVVVGRVNFDMWRMRKYFDE